MPSLSRPNDRGAGDSFGFSASCHLEIFLLNFRITELRGAQKCGALIPIDVLYFKSEYWKTWLNQHLVLTSYPLPKMVGKVTSYPSLALELMSSGVAEFWLLTELCDSIPERGELNTWKEKEKELHTSCNTLNGRTIRKSSVKFSLPELIYSLSKRYSFQ